MKKKFDTWLNAKSETFSKLCGETFTHKEVLLTHLYIIGLILACSLAEALSAAA